jgi:hypothetical protein
MHDATELFAAIEEGDNDRVTAIVTADPALARARDAEGVSALLRARYRFDRAMTDVLLAASPGLDVFESAAFGRVDRLAGLLEEDPGLVTAWSGDGFTALHLAAFFGKDAEARLLLERGADPSVTSRNDLAVQPLHSAAAGRHDDVFRTLVAAGADVRATQRHGWTPLHQAAQHGDGDLVELFLAAGADPAAATDAGEDPGRTAERAGHPAIAECIREAAAITRPVDDRRPL